MQSEQRMLNDENIPPSCRLRVFVHGPLEMWKREGSASWKLVDKDDWGKGRPARSVFKRLLLAPGRRLSRGAIEDDLWPETENFELAEKNVYNAINQIRRVTGKSLITTIDTIYEIADQSLVWVDRDACESLLKQAENQGHRSKESIPLLEQALVYLERGELLEGETGIWVHGLRQKSEDMLKQCRFWLAQAYEDQGKLWQAGEQYRSLCAMMPPNEEALLHWIALYNRQGKVQEGLKCYQDVQKRWNSEGYSTSINLQNIVKKAPKEKEVIKHNMIKSGHELVAEELLGVYREGIMALYELYMNGHPHFVDALLPLYAKQTASLCETGGVFLLQAARLASLAQQLVCELATDREDFGVAQISGQRALDYAQLACDPNLEVAALIKQGSLGFHRRDGRLARHSYDQAIALAHNEPVTPLLRGRAYAGAAEVYAMRGEKQDALRAMELAYEQFPEQPEQDPAYPYLYASRYALHVFGACQTQLFLGNPDEAQKALETLEKEGNTDAAQEPITRLDLLYYQIEILTQQAEQEAVLALLTEAVQLAQQLGSTLYFRKLATSYQVVRARWPHDKAVLSAGEIFL